MGRALARELCDREAIVVVADINRLAVDSVAQALEKSGGGISPAEADLTSRATPLGSTNAQEGPDASRSCRGAVSEPWSRHTRRSLPLCAAPC